MLITLKKKTLAQTKTFLYAVAAIAVFITRFMLTKEVFEKDFF